MRSECNCRRMGISEKREDFRKLIFFDFLKIVLLMDGDERWKNDNDGFVVDMVIILDGK